MNSNEYHRLLSEVHLSRFLIFVLLAIVQRYHGVDALWQNATFLLACVHLVRSLFEAMEVVDDG